LPVPVRCQEDAERLLGEHFSPFADIVHEVVAAFYRDLGPYIHSFEIWTQRGIVRDLLKERMIAYCDANRGLDYVRRGNTTLFCGKNEFVWKIKKINDHFKIARNDSQACFDFDHNRNTQLPLLEDIDPTLLYLGWVPTENDPLNPPVYLVCNNERGEVEWAIRLYPSALPPAAAIIPTEPSAPDAPSRVRAKRSARKPASNG
jgi:hypothetical protein